MTDDTLDIWERMANAPICYTLDADHTPQPERDVLAWAAWMETADRRVAHDYVHGWWVSTVFLGVDGMGLGLVFETATFDPAGELRGTRRYQTWDEALAGHHEIVAQLQPPLGGR